MAVPTSVVAQVPRLTLDRKSVRVGPLAQRTSYIAGLPEPSSTCVNVRVTEVSVAPVTARFVTVPGGPDAVAPVATLESPPNTAVPPFRVPRNSTSWKAYPVARDSPRTVHDRIVLMAVPTSVVAQVPRLTLDAPPQLIVPLVQRTSYNAGLPEPSFPCTTLCRSEVSVAPVTARFVTVPGGPDAVAPVVTLERPPNTAVPLFR